MACRAGQHACITCLSRHARRQARRPERACCGCATGLVSNLLLGLTLAQQGCCGLSRRSRECLLHSQQCNILDRVVTKTPKSVAYMRSAGQPAHVAAVSVACNVQPWAAWRAKAGAHLRGELGGAELVVVVVLRRLRLGAQRAQRGHDGAHAAAARELLRLVAREPLHDLRV